MHLYNLEIAFLPTAIAITKTFFSKPINDETSTWRREHQKYIQFLHKHRLGKINVKKKYCT